MQISALDTTTSPLTAEQAALLNQLVASLSPTQVAWLGGYLSGVAGYTQSLLGLLQPGQNGMATAGTLPSPSAAASGAPEVTILFGSQTGNGEKVAKKLQSAALAKGLQATIQDMGSYRPTMLKQATCLLIIVSTHGEGDPPDRVRELHSFLYGKRAPKLDGVDYSVLALGDRTYRHYCKIGKDFDARLEELGAKRIHDRIDCDVDYEDAAQLWIDGVTALLARKAGPAPAGAAPQGFALGAMAAATTSEYDRKNPFMAGLLERIVLTDEGSEKETLHVEISLEGSGLTYQPGDSLGVFPTNSPELVDAVLTASRLDGDATVTTHEGEGGNLRELLTQRYEIAQLTPDVIEKYANFGSISELQALMSEDRFDDLQSYLHGRDLVDLLQDYPLDMYPNDLVDILRKMTPRLYSLASSLEACPEEAHLCIAPVSYATYGRDRFGVCSSYFARRLEDDGKIPVYIHENNYFRLPEDPRADMIMVGPGTGVAPFRAFMQHREMLGHEGRNWLFFGEQHFRTDFLYQAEWLQWRASGLLTHLDAAFSRDQDHKIYVQHRLKERAGELYEWLQNGAHFYVCGDESRMAHDVHAALVEIVMEQGRLSAEAAEDYVNDLRRSNRYQRDVY